MGIGELISLIPVFVLARRGIVPVQPCQENGKPGYRWGRRGKCYTYIPGNSASRLQARLKAEAQGIAIEVSQVEEREGG